LILSLAAEAANMALSANYRPWRMPDDTPEYLAPAWLGCVSAAFGDPQIVERFKETTRDKWEPRGAEAELAKEISCSNEDFVQGFIDWVNSNIWDRHTYEVRRSVVS
jgi:hypothetical protein